MNVIVTGAGGFIGSSITDEVLRRGDDVVGIDTFTDYYDPAIKRSNLTAAMSNDRFRLVETDLCKTDLRPLMDWADVVFHQAGQPGVRLSWGSQLAEYTRANILATNDVLSAAVAVKRPPRVVYASSSSVYGNALAYPTSESDVPMPLSPYGVTKLAAEHLCRLFAANDGLSTVSLRYFTVYGPRQRPDMAFHRLCNAVLENHSFPLYGDGSQIRDFTYISDVVHANVLAADADVAPGTFVNIAGGSSTTMEEVIALVSELSGAPLVLDRQGHQRGDVLRTGGATEAATRLLGWTPTVTLRDGLAAQIAFHSAMNTLVV